MIDPIFRIYKPTHFGLGVFIEHGKNVFGRKIAGLIINFLFIEIYLGIQAK
tara:strand:- start:128 stop:280 length:153 start_codon:yes stop_codon:yes gene_type:complete